MQQQQIPDNAQLAPPSPPDFGTNNEKLPKELQLEIWDLMMEQERQDEIPRRYEIKDILQRRLYFNGEQYWWWSDSQYCWNPPNIQPEGLADDFASPTDQYSTNIIQPILSGLMSVLSQNNTRPQFYPEKASDPDDVATAKQASKVLDLVNRNNDWQNRVDEATFYMGTDGFVGGYVRYVSDGERFGFDEMAVMGEEEKEISPPSVTCAGPECGFQADGTTEEQPVCPQCGSPLNDNPAMTTTVPKHLATLKLPKGQEVITIVGALQLKRNMWADEQKDFLYLTWISDVHKAKAMSKYPQAREKIKSSSGGSGGNGGTSDTYEAIARRLLYLGTGRHTGMVLEDLGTFRRTWLRPNVFELVTNDIHKQQLLELFPEGCYVAFYNDVYCESKNECMDKRWETMQAMPGTGQKRETLISAIMPVQDQLNDCSNLIFEQGMHGVPEAFGTTDLLDFEARNATANTPGTMTPVTLQPNKRIQDSIFYSAPVQVSPQLMEYRSLLFNEVAQFLSGYFPALFGGDTGGNDTAAGISIQRNQAIGRIGRVWRTLQLFCANLGGKAVSCFAENRTSDTEIPTQDEGGGYKSDYVPVEDMQGQVVAYPEVDAQYPVLQSDKRSVVLTMLTQQDPLFMAVAQIPENLERTFQYLGLSDYEVPGEDQRIKTHKNIDELLQEQPQQGQAPPNPQTPEQAQPQMLPSMVPDQLVDNLPIVIATVKKWLISEKGMEAKQTNQPGYQNVYLYLKAADSMQKMEELKKAFAAQASQGQGPAADLGGSEHIGQPQPPQPPQEKGASDSQS